MGSMRTASAKRTTRGARTEGALRIRGRKIGSGQPWNGGSICRLFVDFDERGYAPADLAAAFHLAVDAHERDTALVVAPAGVLRAPFRTTACAEWDDELVASVHKDALHVATQFRDALGRVAYAVAVGIDVAVAFNGASAVDHCGAQLMATIEPNASDITLSWKLVPVNGEWDVLRLPWDVARDRPARDAVDIAGTFSTLCSQRVVRLVCFDAYAWATYRRRPTSPLKKAWHNAVRRQLAEAMKSPPHLAINLMHIAPRRRGGGFPPGFAQAWKVLSSRVSGGVVACGGLKTDDPQAFARVSEWARCDFDHVDVHVSR